MTLLASFFTAMVYWGVERTVVSSIGASDSGRFGMLKAWGRKGVRFGLYGGINSCRVISVSIAF